MFKKEQRYSFRKKLPASSFNTIFFTLRFEKSVDKSFSSGIVVSKKVDRLAVRRNKLKREFVHALKEVIKDKKITYSLVFFLKKASSELTFEKMTESIKIALEKAKIIL